MEIVVFPERLLYIIDYTFLKPYGMSKEIEQLCEVGRIQRQAKILHGHPNARPLDPSDTAADPFLKVNCRQHWRDRLPDCCHVSS